MHSSKAALMIAVGILTSCSLPSEPESSPNATGESASALGYAVSVDAGPKPPRGPSAIAALPLTVRRLIRAQSPGCATVEGAGGVWNGAPVSSGDLSSTSFCSYAWASATKATPDLASLDAVAMSDDLHGEPYNVHDPRATNAPAEEANLASPYVAMSPSLGLAANTTMRRSSGCGVCVSLESGYLWLILPPEATWGPSVMLHSGNATYPLGVVSGPAYYAPAPPGLADSLSLSW